MAGALRPPFHFVPISRHSGGILLNTQAPSSHWAGLSLDDPLADGVPHQLGTGVQV
jgi:hypothetical protein